MDTAFITTYTGKKNMPLNAKGAKIMKAFKKQYGAEKGKKVFYAAENKGTIKGVTRKKVLG